MNPITPIFCLIFAIQTILPANLPLNKFDPIDPALQALCFVSKETKQAELGINSVTNLRHLRSVSLDVINNVGNRLTLQAQGTPQTQQTYSYSDIYKLASVAENSFD